MFAPHLKKIRPFLGRGDFAPGSWGQATVDALQPVDVAVEKVAYSAFYMSRLEWVIRKLGVTYPVLLDEQSSIARRYGVVGLPTTYFVDAEGVVRGKGIGEADEAVFERHALALLK